MSWLVFVLSNFVCVLSDLTACLNMSWSELKIRLLPNSVILDNWAPAALNNTIKLILGLEAKISQKIM